MNVDLDINTKKLIREFPSFWRTHVYEWLVGYPQASKIASILPFTVNIDVVCTHVVF